MNVRLEIGDDAPDFNLPDDSGTHLSKSSIRQNMVIYFYPKDNTPGCTIEANDFASLNQEFINFNTKVIGVSKDSVRSHEKFKLKYNLPFALISDESAKMCSDYGVWSEKSMFGKKYMGIARQTFLIGIDGKIKHIWRKVSIKNHAHDVLNKVKQILQ